MSTRQKTGSEILEEMFGPLYFKDLFYAYRLGEELTQQEMADQLGISKQKVCDYEKGRRLPSMIKVVDWAKFLGAPYEVWVEAYLQQQVDEANLQLKVEVKSRAS